MEKSRVQRSSREIMKSLEKKIRYSRDYGISASRLSKLVEAYNAFIPPNGYCSIVDGDFEIYPIPFGELRGTIEED